MRRTAWMTLILTTMLSLTACAGAGDATDPEVASGGLDAVAPTTTMSGSGTMPAEAGADGELLAYATPEGRKVIHRASISIEAEDTRSVHAEVQAMVDAVDGFIESATVSDASEGEDQPRIHMVLRIPASELATTLDVIGQLGTRIVSQSQQGEDVTEHYVDVEARVANLSLLESELRELLEVVRANEDADPAKLLQVFNEISRVRGEIEQYQGQLQVLDDLTSLATVEVSVAPTPAVSPVVAEGWAPLVVARSALADLVGTFQGLGDLAIRFVIYVLPVALIVVGIPAFLAWRFLRGRISSVRRVTQEAPEG